MNPYLDIHTHHAIPKGAIGIINLDLNEKNNETRWFSKGIHPWDIDKITINDALVVLKKELTKGNCLALGEIGIDRSIDIPLNTQVDVFNEQLELNQSLNKPIILHAVRSWSDLIGIKKKVANKTPWIYHGFNGNLQTAKQIIKQGDYLSFGPQILRNKKILEVFKLVPVEHVFLETDNSQEKIENMYHKIGEMSHICAEKLKEQLHLNFKTVFGL